MQEQPYTTKQFTVCCGLAYLNAWNNTPLESIQNFIEEAKKESESAREWDSVPGEPNHLIGQRAYYCITSPKELPLEEKLKACGFEHITSFKRRYCYLGDQDLKMWMIKW